MSEEEYTNCSFATDTLLSSTVTALFDFTTLPIVLMSNSTISIILSHSASVIWHTAICMSIAGLELLILYDVVIFL